MSVVTSYTKQYIDNNLVHVNQIGTLEGPKGDKGDPGESAEVVIVTTQAEADAVPPGTVAIIRNPA